jgi:amino acid permease
MDDETQREAPLLASDGHVVPAPGTVACEQLEVCADGAVVDAGLDSGGGEAEPKRAEVKTASVGVTLINVVCNVIGGGVLALPTAFNQSSLFLGVLLLAGMTMLAVVNLMFIVLCAEHTKTFNYLKLLHDAFGDRPARIVDVALVMFPFGALVAYCRATADAMPPVMVNFFGIDRDAFLASQGAWFLFGSICFFVLSCRRSLSELLVSSIFGIATIMWAISIVVFRFFDGSYSTTHTAAEVDHELEVVYLHKDIFRTIPVITFALSAHNNAPAYYHELADRSPARIAKAFVGGNVIIFTAYVLIGIFGLLTFGPRIASAKGNILDAYAEDDGLMNSARFVIFIHFACVFPILQMAARRGFNNLVFGHNEFPLKWLCVESFFIVCAATGLAAVVPDIDVVLSYSGAIFGSIIVLIAPSALYIKLRPLREHPHDFKICVVAGVSSVLGVVVGIISTVITTIDIATGDEG